MVVRCRGYVWEPDRNDDEEKKEFITFIAQVEGLSAVPDGRIFMNAYIDAIKGAAVGVEEKGTKYKKYRCYSSEWHLLTSYHCSSCFSAQRRD